LASLPAVISDTDGVYLYGLDIIAQQQSERFYYMHDGLGSVRQLVDTTGQIETNYAYDPFGVPVVEGDGSNPYQYTGEAWDAEVELLYLRARYYQPEAGRFVTRDLWPGDRLRPSTLNPYLYVHNNSVNYIDPTGLDFLGPGGACPECAPEPGVGTGDVRVPPMSEIALMLLAPPWDPAVLYYDWVNYQERGYSSRASLGLAELLVASWFLPVPQEHYWFGPEHSFTQDVRHDPAMSWFKQEWARADPPFKVPFSLRHHRDFQTGSLCSQLIGWTLFVQENSELGQCVLGRGSDTAAGPIDPVGGILGSFELMEVKWAGFARVRFEVLNVMDRASGSRLPGTSGSLLLPVDRKLSETIKGNWWGTTVYQHFYWEEAYPLRPGSY
jgi:RHS repeat-associated protein